MHGPPAKLEKDNASQHKAKIGLWLFFFYGLVYTGFIVINTVSPKTMGFRIIAGLNLAVVYGFGLIVLAIVMGLIYNHYCGLAEKRANASEEEAE
jgi:uncharacterized membrane protein (DUF485 family)